MLLTLPTELIERILRVSLPSQITIVSYSDRQLALRNVSLVNTLLRAISQPILREVVIAETGGGWDSSRRLPTPESCLFLARLRLDDSVSSTFEELLTTEQHARVCTGRRTITAAKPATFDTLSSIIEKTSDRGSLRISRLYLPPSFTPVPPKAFFLAPSLGRFLRVCGARGIAVVREKDSRRYGYEVSQDFLEYAKEQRRAIES